MSDFERMSFTHHKDCGYGYYPNIKCSCPDGYIPPQILKAVKPYIASQVREIIEAIAVRVEGLKVTKTHLGYQNVEFLKRDEVLATIKEMKE